MLLSRMESGSLSALSSVLWAAALYALPLPHIARLLSEALPLARVALPRSLPTLTALYGVSDDDATWARLFLRDLERAPPSDCSSRSTPSSAFAPPLSRSSGVDAGVTWQRLLLGDSDSLAPQSLSPTPVSRAALAKLHLVVRDSARRASAAMGADAVEWLSDECGITPRDWFGLAELAASAAAAPSKTQVSGRPRCDSAGVGGQGDGAQGLARDARGAHA